MGCKLPAPIRCIVDPKKYVGNIAEAVITARYMQAGCVVLVPFGGSERYDLVIDRGDGRFLRVQCKSARIVNGVVVFSACSVDRTGKISRSYHGEAELLTAYCRDNDKVYEVPLDVCPRHEVRLRIDPAKNNQSSGVRMASDYEMLAPSIP